MSNINHYIQVLYKQKQYDEIYWFQMIFFFKLMLYQIWKQNSSQFWQWCFLWWIYSTITVYNCETFYSNCLQCYHTFSSIWKEYTINLLRMIKLTKLSWLKEYYERSVCQIHLIHFQKKVQFLLNKDGALIKLSIFVRIQYSRKKYV